MVSTQPMKILAFDGGPSALVSIRVIQKMEEQFPGFLDRVDVFAGTSFGGILSLKLATLLSDKVPAARAIEESIDFTNEFLGLFKMTPTNLLRMVSGFLPVISSQGMLDFLKKHFTTDPTDPDNNLLMIRDLEKKVTVSAFDLSINELRTFNNFGPRYGSNITLLSAALACSSVPVFAPFLKPAGDDAAPIVDGGFGANSGAMPALSDALWYLGRDNPNTHAGDILPHITLLSMGCKSTDDRVRIPLISPLLDLAEELGLIGREQAVPDGNTPRSSGDTLRSIGWFFLVRNNVKVALSLLENTQALDLHYARTLLDCTRYHRMAPKLKVLNLLWLMMTDTKAAIDEADAVAKKYWAAQVKRYADWTGPRPKSPPVLQHYNELACWLDWYWMGEQKPATTAPVLQSA